MIVNEREHLSEGPMEKWGNHHLHMSSSQMSQTHRRDGILVTRGHISTPATTSCPAAVDWRWSRAHKQTHTFNSKPNGWWWMDKSPEPWIHLVSVTNESHIKPACHIIITTQSCTMLWKKCHTTQPMDMSPGASWGLWLPLQSRVRVP